MRSLSFHACGLGLSMCLAACSVEVSGRAPGETEPDVDGSDTGEESRTGDGDGPDSAGDGDHGDGDGDAAGDADSGDGDGDTGDGDQGDGDGDTGDGDGDGDAPPLPDDVDEDAVAPFLTTGDERTLFAQGADLRFAKDASLPELTITVHTGDPLQEIDGFGAQLPESASYLFATKLDDSERKTLLRRLFDRTGGIGLTVLRQPIGASSFALGVYSYDDSAPDLSDFSIAREHEHTIPLLREAKALNPDLLLFAAPWSAPAWMKSERSMLGGGLKKQFFPEFAEYLARFASAYRELGLPVYALSPQHEPYHSPADADFPTMYMDGQEQGEFVAEHLGPALDSAGLDTHILAWDHNWDDAELYTREMLEHQGARERVAGTGLHCYVGDPSAQTRLHERDPEKHVWFTECSATTSLGGFDGLFGDSMRLGVSVLQNWSRTFLRGSLALDEQHGPRVGGCGDCTGTLEIGSTGDISLSGEFYALSHFSRFVRKGARHVRSEVSGPESELLAQVAFVNPDGSRVLVVYNQGTRALSFGVSERDRGFTYTLPARAALTLHWARSTGPLSLAGATIRASSGELTHPAERAIDGDLRTRWSSGFPQGGNDWLELDLGTPQRFSAITLDAGDSTLDYPRSFTVEVSNDGTSYTAMASASGDAALVTLPFAETEARFLRVRSTGNTAMWWSVHELTLHK